jgi:hypothetical protein
MNRVPHVQQSRSKAYSQTHISLCMPCVHVFTDSYIIVVGFCPVHVNTSVDDGETKQSEPATPD